MVGTLSIAVIALIIATPLSVLTALYLSEIARPRLCEWLKPVIELLASVPTVVLGFFGLMLVAPALVSLLGSALHLESGRCLLTAALIMSVLVAPTMVSVFEDALRAAPGSLRDGALALGLTGGEMMRRVLLPAVRPGLIAALLLGFARAVGETMIVWILSGGAALMPQLSFGGLVGPVRGIPDTVGIEMANVEFEMPHYGHLFLIGLILFLITTAVNLTGYWFTRRRAWQL